MAVFSSRRFRPSAYNHTIAARYRAAVKHHPFALFGFPFILTVLAGSFFLTPATAIRYEVHDRKVQNVTEETRIGLGKGGRKVDKVTMAEEYAKLAGRDLENWENKRVERLKGEHDGIL